MREDAISYFWSKNYLSTTYICELSIVKVIIDIQGQKLLAAHLAPPDDPNRPGGKNNPCQLSSSDEEHDQKPATMETTVTVRANGHTSALVSS